MNRGIGLLGGLGLGAGLMYFLDPQSGRRRRSQARDQLIHLMSKADDAVCCVGRDMGHRAQGLAAEARSMLVGEEVSDRQLAERVRSKLGRVVSHPGAIHVAADNGQVTLTGRALAHEAECLLTCVGKVRGVTGVANRLELHEQPGHVADLQGGGRRPGSGLDLLQENWAPGTRAVVGGVGGGLLVYGLTCEAPQACVLGSAGLALVARAVANVPFGQLVGLSGTRAVEIHKTLTIAGPVERVFPFFASYENFPRFMAHLRAVENRGRGRSHWVAVGPAGVPVSWDAVITQYIPNRLIAWQSEPGSVIANAGVIRFAPAGDDTRVDISLAYNPPAGVLGHLAAMLFGTDAKSSMNEDLIRLKALIEEGRTSAPGKPEVARQDITGRSGPVPQPAL